MKPGFTTFRLKDIGELQDLVAAYAESVEPGLKILDARVLLGETTIDLIGQDKEGGLVLLALGFEADDEVLLRALDAYSWCLESPEALRRLYPAARVSAAEPPRLVIIAERVPETFLRKCRHLKVRSLDCLEFSFGLHFRTVSGARAAEPPARAAAPTRADARVDTQPFVADPLRSAEPLRGAEAPRSEGARGVHVDSVVPARPLREEPLEPAAPAASQAPGRWRRMLEDGQVDEWKVKVVRDYLQREFPTSVIYDFYAHDRSGQMFHLQDSYGDVIHSVCVAEAFLTEHAEAEIRAFFDTHKLARVLRQAGQAGVSIATGGIRIERT